MQSEDIEAESAEHQEVVRKALIELFSLWSIGVPPGPINDFFTWNKLDGPGYWMTVQLLLLSDLNRANNSSGVRKS